MTKKKERKQYITSKDNFTMASSGLYVAKTARGKG
jgi:hypothetical protein